MPELNITNGTPNLSVTNETSVLTVSNSITRLVKVIAEGPQGIQGIQGIPGTGGDLNYVHNQTVPAVTWNVTHGLGKIPSCTIIDSAGDYILADVAYPDNNTVTINLTGSMAGRAIFN